MLARGRTFNSRFPCTPFCVFNDAQDVEDKLKANRGEIAAVIPEPIAHNIGCVLPRAGFLGGLRALCSAHGAVLIFDEVVTGFRHGLGGYQKICGVTLDLTSLGKAMADGFPSAEEVLNEMFSPARRGAAT